MPTTNIYGEPVEDVEGNPVETDLDLQPVTDEPPQFDLEPVPEEEEEAPQVIPARAAKPTWFDPNLAGDQGIRSRFAEELKDPRTADQLFSLTHREVGGQGPEAQQAFIETVFNRAASRNMSLAQTMGDRKYYPEKSLSRARYSDADAARYRNLAINAWEGSNISNYATGNASGNVGVGQETYRSRGERFGVEKPDRHWYE